MSDIVTLKDLKNHLGIAGTNALDARLQMIIAGVSEIMRDETGRDWAVADRVVDKPGSGRPALVLEHYPLVSVSVVTVGGSALDVGTDPLVDPFLGTADIYADKEQGILYRLDGQLSANFAVGAEAEQPGFGGGPITQVFDHHHYAQGRVWPADRTRLIHIEYKGGAVPSMAVKLALLEICAWMYGATGGKKSVQACGVSTSLWAGALNELPTAQQTLARLENLGRYGRQM